MQHHSELEIRMNVMTPLLGVVVAGLSGSIASGQGSQHLSDKYLKQATPLIHWPKGLEPASADVFVHNEGWINAPPEVVWANLIDATKWPSWYANSADVRIEGGHSKLASGATFHWRTFGFRITSTVDVFQPNREIGWSVDNSSLRVHHAWLLIPDRGGTRVLTEEAQKGADAIKFRLEQPNAMYDGHDWWMSGLKARSERMAEKPRQ
jgi:uncharacterized protein YndB with AHSA1/START domain